MARSVCPVYPQVVVRCVPGERQKSGGERREIGGVFIHYSTAKEMVRTARAGES